jgi:hypothetical protein
MRLLRFFSRVAFICNVCFLLASFVQWLPNPPEGPLVSLIILCGYVLSILVNCLLNLTLLVVWLAGKSPQAQVPRWLLIVNFLFFILQLILILVQIPK